MPEFVKNMDPNLMWVIGIGLVFLASRNPTLAALISQLLGIKPVVPPTPLPVPTPTPTPVKPSVDGGNNQVDTVAANSEESLSSLVISYREFCQIGHDDDKAEEQIKIAFRSAISARLSKVK